MPEVPAGLIGLPAKSEGGDDERHEPGHHADPQGNRPSHGRAGELHQPDDENGGQESPHSRQSRGGQVPFQGASHDRQVGADGTGVDARAADQGGHPDAEQVHPFGDVIAVGVETAHVLTHPALVTAGVEFGECRRRLGGGRRQEEHEEEHAGSADRSADEDPGDHQASSSPAGAVTVRKRRGSRTPDSRLIHIIPRANRMTTTRRTSWPWTLS